MLLKNLIMKSEILLNIKINLSNVLNNRDLLNNNCWFFYFMRE